MRYLIYFIFACVGLHAQNSENVLNIFEKRMDSVMYFEVEAKLNLDISFVNMAEKMAWLKYDVKNGFTVKSEDFIMIPKKGMDLTFREIFKYPYMSLSIGQIKVRNRMCEGFRLIPDDSKADFSIATIWIDVDKARPLQMEISTKKNGVFMMHYYYGSESVILPNLIDVEFEVSDLKIPLRYLGKEANVDQSKLKEVRNEKGTIHIHLSNYKTKPN